jgi:TonB-linked SusC/RagA family outer membrane protein
MKISTFCWLQNKSAPLKKFFLVMKLAAIIVFISVSQISASVYGQRMNFKATNISLERLFREVKKQTGYSFIYRPETVAGLPNIAIEADDATVQEVLDKMIADRPLEYTIINKTVVLKRKANSTLNSTEAGNVLVFGKVIDEKDMPLPGVKIKLKDHENIWITNEKGEFSSLITVENPVLVFSFIGYATQEIAVKSIKSPFVVKMKVVSNDLDQVQVLAYGTTTKRLNTSHIVTITADEIAKSPVQNVLQALENKVPGMFIQQNSGIIGSSFNVQVRGGSSLVTGALPLYVVDGVQYPSGGLPFINGLATPSSSFSNPPNLGGSALNYLNPADIESIEVLKDADATALYGSRASYGVILITTKKAKSGAGRLDVNAFEGITTKGVTPPLLNTQQYLMLRREAFKNDGVNPGVTDLDLNGKWPEDRYNDFRKFYLKNTAQNQNAYLTYSGGAGSTNFLISGNIRNQRTIQKGKGGEIDGGMRFDINNTSPNKKLFIDLTGTYNLSRNNAIPYDFATAINAAPNSPLPILPDGSLDWSTGTNAAAVTNALYLNTNNNFIVNGNIKYNILKNLNFNVRAGFNILTNKEFRALPTSYFVPSPNAYASTSSTISNYTSRTLTVDPNINYVQTFLKKGSIDARAGITFQDANTSLIAVNGTGFNSDALLGSPSSASGSVTASYTTTPDRYTGTFALIHINWDNKYLISLNGRRDGSTKFGPRNRFGNFGSVAGAWILSEEPWMKSIAGVLNFAKLTANYGTSGGDQIFAYSYLNTFNVTPTPYSGTIGVVPSKIANPDLHWESKKSQDLGLTLQFLKGRIEIDGSYYRAWTTDPLISSAITNVTGFANVLTNIPDAKLLSYGYEFSLSTKNIKSKNFSWSTTINFTSPHSKLLSYPGLSTLNSVNLNNVNLVLGKPITGVRLYNYAGINPETGNYSFINAKGAKGDFNAFNLNNVTDRTEYIDLAPKYYGGISNSFSYKKLSVDVFLSVTKRMAKNINGYQMNLPGSFNVNPTTTALKRWQNPGDITDQPKVSQSFFGILSQNAFVSSTGAYSRVTYARINNVNINYEISGQWLKKANIKRLGVYLQGQNLATFSKYKDLDPESLSANSTGPLRVFVVGFNISL